MERPRALALGVSTRGYGGQVRYTHASMLGARRWAALGKQVDGRRVVILEEEGARTARDPLHGGGTADAVLLVAAEREWHRGPATHQYVAPQLLAEHEGVLDGHAAALPQRGLHGVHGVAEQADVAVGPPG